MMENIDPPRMPAVTTGVASSYDLPDPRHDLREENSTNEPGGIRANMDPGQFVPPFTLEQRVAHLERQVGLLIEAVEKLWAQARIDVPIDVHSAE